MKLRYIFLIIGALLPILDIGSFTAYSVFANPTLYFLMEINGCWAEYLDLTHMVSVCPGSAIIVIFVSSLTYFILGYLIEILIKKIKRTKPKI